MQKLLFAVGTSFLRAFGAALLTFVLGILAAPNYTIAVSLSIAALLASIAAGLRAVQVWVPLLTFARWVRQPVAAYLDSFSRAGISAFIVSITGWLLAPDLTTWKAVITAAVVGALAAGFRSIQGAATPGESPQPGAGITVPADRP
jgi:hypothetical protein